VECLTEVKNETAAQDPSHAEGENSGNCPPGRLCHVSQDTSGSRYI